MAKILLADFVTAIAGKVQGTVYSKNRYGYYRKAKPNPTNPQTTRQQERRSLFGAFSAAWRGLTDAQRLAWKALSEVAGFITIFGESKSLTGNALYVGCNSNLQTIGEAQINNAPLPPSIPAITKAEVSDFTVTGGKLQVSTDFAASPATEVPAGTKMVVYATPPLSPGISAPSKTKFRVIAVDDEGDSTANRNYLTEYEDTFGTPSADQRIFVRVALIDIASGFAGTPFQVDGITG